MPIIYRFRPMRNLINKYDELEDQELVLSSPRYMNDPLEGYQDVFWEGDEVLWENLLRHYLLNLYQEGIRFSLIADNEDLDEYAIDAKFTRGEIPTDEYRQQFASVCQAFFEEKGFGIVPLRLTSLPKPLRRKSLEMVLLAIHSSALESVFEVLPTSGITSETSAEVHSSEDLQAVVEMLENLSTAMDEDTEAQWLESMASRVNPLGSHALLERELQNGEGLELHKKKEIFLFGSYPDRYIRAICDSLIHVNWHMLSFTTECASPSMWAAYANEHQGAALMFRTDKQSEESWSELTVRGRTGWKGTEPIHDEIQASLYTVDYESPPPQVNFFQFLGTLPRPKLTNAWHSTPDGEISPIVDEIFEDEDAWRENLWDNFRNMTTKKLNQWKHEQEVRMVIPDLLGSEGPRRKVTYDLSQLEGVVFGLRTGLEDRFEVMRIIQENSQDSDSNSVDFYQMVFDGTDFKKVKLDV